jgi:dTDP-4-dehydrorhamnose 3,5-epimerase
VAPEVDYIGPGRATSKAAREERLWAVFAATVERTRNTGLKVTSTAIPDVLIIEPKVFGDARGFFFESFNQKAFNEATGLNVNFVQDNHSRSAKGVLRGLHYQIQQPQGKLVRVVRGSVFDVAVDIRKGSPTFGKWEGIELTEENNKQFWVPAGFAHGFVVLSDSADFLYKTTDYYAPEFERCIAWNDPTIGIDWPLERNSIAIPKLSAKDLQGTDLNNALVPVL